MTRLSLTIYDFDHIHKYQFHSRCDRDQLRGWRCRGWWLC